MIIKKIFSLLENNNFEINQELREQLISNNLYPTNNQLRNMKRAGKTPKLPYSAQFVMDYSIYDIQMFRMDKIDNTQMKFKYSKTEWSNLEINLPINLRPMLTGQIAKPKFYYKNGKYIGDINYKIKPLEQEETNNILGVDYGIINTYSASVLYYNGSTSQQLLPSKRLLSLGVKLSKLQDEKKAVTNKIDKVIPYLNSEFYLETTRNKQSRRLEHELDLKQKIINLKEEIAWLSAVELVELAIQYQCSTIHIDYLRWLESMGGKWNYSDCQSRLFEIAELYGIRVERVNTANSSTTHPITNEQGKISNRLVKFSDGEFVCI